MTRPEGADTRPASKTITAGGARAVALASIVAAASGYGVIVLAARALTKEDNTEFLVFWSLIFCAYGVFAGVQSETTRATGSDGAGRGAPIMPWVLGVGAAGAVLLGVTALGWSEELFRTTPVPAAAAASAGVLVFAGHSGLAGALAGQRRWSTYSVLVGTEALTRLLLAATVAWFGPSIVGLEAATAGASAVWLVLLAWPAMRRASRARADVPLGMLARNTGHALIAAASNAVLVVGFVVLLQLTTPAAEFDLAAPLILAVMITRAPLLIPLTAFQGVALSHFVAHRSSGLGTLRRILALIAVVGLVATVLAGLVGDPILRFIFTPSYGVPGTVLAGLTIGATALAVTTMTGAATLALGAHAAYSSGWFAATVVSIGALLLPFGIETRAVTALIVGPLVGATLHGLAIARDARRLAPPPIAT